MTDTFKVRVEPGEFILRVSCRTCGGPLTLVNGVVRGAGSEAVWVLQCANPRHPSFDLVCNLRVHGQTAATSHGPPVGDHTGTRWCAETYGCTQPACLNARAAYYADRQRRRRAKPNEDAAA